MPAGNLVEFSTYICKTSFDKSTNKMRWRMTASDTGDDFYDERMSVELFNSFVRRINNDELVPETYRAILREKSGWDGGMPYTSVSHYKSGSGGANIPGDVDAVYIDGETLKAKGTFRDTELGRAVFKSINEDLAKVSKFDLPIRVSIGFLDFKHSHGDFVFERKSLEDVCPMCDNEAGNKQYLDGQLVHFAFTRIPANERTDVGLEEKSMADEIRTREEDAESIVGKDLAEQLEVNRSKALDTVLVERSDEPVVEEAKKMEKEPVADEEEETGEEEDDKKKVKKEKSAVELALENVLSAKSIEDADAALASLAETVKSALPQPEVPQVNPEIESVRSLVEKSQADILAALGTLTE